MDPENQFASLRVCAALSDCDRVWLSTSVQRANHKDVCLFPHTFQLELTLDEEEEDIKEVEERSADSSSGLSLSEETISVSSTYSETGDETVICSTDPPSSQDIMATQSEETLVMRRQVESLKVEEDEVILEARSRTFVRWINGCLHNKGIRIQNLDSDLESGVVLIKLLETLAPEKRIPGRLVFLFFFQF